MGRALWAPQQGLSKIKEARGVWLSPAWLSLRGNLSSELQAVGRNLTQRLPSTAGCHPVGVWGRRWDFVGNWCLAVEERH